MKFNEGWKFNQEEEPEDYSAARCFFGAAGILCLVLVGFVLVVIGLSMGGYIWTQ